MQRTGRQGAGARWGGLSAGALSGLLAAAAFPGVGLWPLAWVAQAPALWWLYRHRPGWRRAALVGWVDGLVLHVVVYHWIAGTLEDMSGAPTPLAWLGVLGHGAVMGLHQALWAAGVAHLDRLTRANGPLRALVAASVYAGVEFALPYQFPWTLGNALYAAPMWLQAADVVGVQGVSGLCVLISGLLAVAALASDRRRRIRPLALAAVALALWGGYGGLRSWQRGRLPVVGRATFAVVQPNPSLAEKRATRARDRLPMLERAIALTRGLDLRGVDVVLWPEGSLPFFHVPLPGEPAARGLTAAQMRAPPVLLRTVRRVRALVREVGRPFILGTLRRTDPLWRERARNAALLQWPDGRAVYYDKQLLVPFGEYLPGRDLFPSLATAIPGVSDMAPGEGGAVFEIGGVKVALTICYEALFSGHVRDKAAAADVIINLTDDVWFGKTSAPELHLMAQVPRAIELRRPLVRVAATGVSAVVDDLGRVVRRTPVFEPATFVQTVEVRHMGSPFRLWGTWPLWLLTSMIVLAALAAWRPPLSCRAAPCDRSLRRAAPPDIGAGVVHVAGEGKSTEPRGLPRR